VASVSKLPPSSRPSKTQGVPPVDLRDLVDPQKRRAMRDALLDVFGVHSIMSESAARGGEGNIESRTRNDEGRRKAIQSAARTSFVIHLSVFDIRYS
jgi:hypothetical protein